MAGLAASLPERLPSRSVKAAQPFAITQLARHFEALTEQEPVVRAGSVEAVHRMRVTARHLEVLVKAFASRSPSWVVRERAILRKLIKSLGHLRDRDVQIASLGPDQDLVPVREKLQQERDAAHAALVALLDTTELREWMRAWRRELAKPEARASADESTAQVARELIRAQARKLRKRGDRIDDESSPEDYHEVRIRAKRLRYLLDAFAGLYGTAATEYLAALTKLQDILGLYHDTVVLAERLSELARDAALSTSSAFALGRLVESGAVCRDKFPKAWRRVRRKRWRALEAAMQSCAEESR